MGELESATVRHYAERFECALLFLRFVVVTPALSNRVQYCVGRRPALRVFLMRPDFCRDEKQERCVEMAMELFVVKSKLDEQEKQLKWARREADARERDFKARQRVKD